MDPGQPRSRTPPAGDRGDRGAGAGAERATARRDDAPGRLHAVRSGGQGRRRHDRARGGPPARRRPRHGVRWPRDLRALPGDAEHRPLRQVAHRRRTDVARGLRRRSSSTTTATARLPPATASDAPPASWATSWSTYRPTSQVHRQVVRKDLQLASVTVDPSLPAVLRRGAAPLALGDAHERRRRRSPPPSPTSITCPRQTSTTGCWRSSTACSPPTAAR